MLGVEKIAIFDCRCGITKIVSWQIYVKEKFHTLSFDFYWIVISAIETHSNTNSNIVLLLHDCMEHHESIIEL